MTNREKYAEQILDIACGGNAFAVNKETEEVIACNTIDCTHCKFNYTHIICHRARARWCNAEYIEPQIDWSKVPVDTPILVKDIKNDEWRHRHFAKFEDGVVYAWRAGCTSWSKSYYDEDDYLSWKYAKLAEDGDKNEME